MKTFEELKQELLDRAKNANACQTGYKMGLKASNKADLLKAITANWFWVLHTSKIVDASFLEENFTEEELAEVGIYTKKFHIVKTIAFACGNATVKAYGNATVEACDSATVEACDNATVKAFGSATVKAFGSATVEAYESATVKACGNSYTEDCAGGDIRPQSDYAIVKDYSRHKIYIKKGAFEIIEV